jgi:hypothetical protein
MPAMNKILIAASLLAVVLCFAGLSGCKSDPHDTHIATGIAVPR